jgi:hypothetical protein
MQAVLRAPGTIGQRTQPTLGIPADPRIHALRELLAGWQQVRLVPVPHRKTGEPFKRVWRGIAPPLNQCGRPFDEIVDLVVHRTTIVTQKVHRHQLKPIITNGPSTMNTIFAATKPA